MTRQDILDPPGASDSTADAPSTFEERRPIRARKSTQKVLQNQSLPSKPRKSRKVPPSQSLPSPISLQIAESSSQLSNPPTLEPIKLEDQQPSSQEEEQEIWGARFKACRQDKALLQAALLEFYPGESYERLAVPERTCEIDLEEIAEAEHSSPSNPLPLFRLFFPQSVIRTIAENTNTNARLQEAENKHLYPRKWESIRGPDIEKLFGALFMIGANAQSGPLEEYWNMLPESPIHP